VNLILYKEIPNYPELTINYLPDLDCGSYGECIADKGIINISLSRNTNQALLDKTLFHELLHYVLYKTGWSEMISNLGEKSEEGLVLMLENNLIQLVTFETEYEVEED